MENRSLRFCYATLALIVASAIATAGNEIDEDLFADHRVASADTLSDMRGGFAGSVGGQRLEVSFGIEQAVMVNDKLVAVTRLNVPNISDVTQTRIEHVVSDVLGNSAPAATQQAVAAPDPVSITTLQSAEGVVKLVQIGTGNSFALSSAQMPSGVLNVIQNTLDNQVIKQTTGIQMSVNSLALMRNMLLADALQRQVGASLR